uniref:Uncharacterized protein n=1 Tax=Knipowitschia caucasica TaxID=637954 RepID=A0AAV2KBV3_KNICA
MFISFDTSAQTGPFEETGRCLLTVALAGAASELSFLPPVALRAAVPQQLPHEGFERSQTRVPHVALLTAGGACYSREFTDYKEWALLGLVQELL